MIYILLFIISFYLISRTRRLDYLLDPIVYFYLTHFVFFGIGLWYESFIWSRDLSDTIRLIPSLLLFQFSLIVFILDFSLRKKKEKDLMFITYFNKIACNIPKSMYVAAWIYWTIGISLVYIYFVLSIGWDNLFSEDLDNIRVEGRKGFGWMAILSIALITISSIYLFIVNVSKKRFFFTYIISIFSLLFLFLTGNRGPAFELLVILIVIYYMSEYGRVSFFKLIIFAILIIFMLGALNLFRQGDSFDWYLLFLKSLWRPYVNIDNFNFVFEYFNKHEILYGYGYWIDFAVLLPGYQPNFGLWFKDAAGLDFSGGSVTVTYAGEIIANFGFNLLFFFSTFYFLFIYFISLILSKKESIQSFILLVVSSLAIKGVVSSGLITPFLYVFVPFLIGFVLIELTASGLKRLIR